MDYKRSKFYGLAETIPTLMLPLVLIDTNILLRETLRVSLGESSALLEQLKGNAVRFVIPRHVVTEFFEEDKLQRITERRGSAPEMRRTFIELFAPFLTVLSVDDAWLQHGLQVPDADDQPLATLTEILEPDAVLSDDQKHLAKLNISSKSADVLFALRWGQNELCLTLTIQHTITISSVVISTSGTALFDVAKRIPTWVWAFGVGAMLGALAHPTSRKWMSDQLHDLPKKLTPLAQSLSRELNQFALEYGTVKLNAQLAEPEIEKAKPNILKAKTEVGMAIRILARARQPLSIEQIRQRMGQETESDVKRTQRLAEALAVHPLVKRLKPGQWVLNGVPASQLLEHLK
jgi:hypothetical protein